MTISADLPIKEPSQDAFSIDQFAKALGSSIAQMPSPEGTVIALNGNWGSGKTSTVNLVLHHLTNGEFAEVKPEIVQFNPWWFRGEEALTIAFFRELGNALKAKLTDRAKKLLPKIGARLLRAGSSAAPVIDIAGAGGAATAASGTLDWLADLITDDESVEKLHAEISKALRNQDQRFLIVIDDIDRLSPNEALAVFRLVKSVGRLPNIIYLLSFDRELAEKAIADSFPSEGPHYLEKIIQLSFDLPKPDEDDLRQYLLERVYNIIGFPKEDEAVEFMNLFHEAVAPYIRSPRDAIKLVNNLSVTYPAVKGDVFAGDFLALEAMRIFEHDLYLKLRQNGSLLTANLSSLESRHTSNLSEQWNSIFIGSHPEADRIRRVIMRLFPVGEAVWRNTWHTSSEPIWRRRRRVSSSEHFETYFRFSLSKKAVPQKTIDAFIENQGDARWISTELSKLAVERSNGTSDLARLLETLTSFASDIKIENAANFLRAIFSVADDIYLEGDEAKGMSFGDNRLRIHWLLRSILMERTSLEERSAVLLSAARSAQTYWLIDLARSAWADWNPRAGKDIELDKALLTYWDTFKLRKLALLRLRMEASAGTLIEFGKLSFLLWNWHDFSQNGATEVRNWTDKVIEDEEAALKLAFGFTYHTWSHGMGFSDMGDLVAKRTTSTSLKQAESIIDVGKLLSKLELLTANKPLAEKGVRAKFLLDAYERERTRDEF